MFYLQPVRGGGREMAAGGVEGPIVTTTRIQSVREYFETLGTRFVPDAARGVDAVFQFEISGEGGGDWHVVVRDGEMAVQPGRHDRPSAVVSASAGDYVAIANGEVDGLRAVMSRKLRISGNLVIARKMQHMFPTGRS